VAHLRLGATFERRYALDALAAVVVLGLWRGTLNISERPWWGPTRPAGCGLWVSGPRRSIDTGCTLVEAAPSAARLASCGETLSTIV